MSEAPPAIGALRIFAESFALVHRRLPTLVLATLPALVAGPLLAAFGVWLGDRGYATGFRPPFWLEQVLGPALILLAGGVGAGWTAGICAADLVLARSGFWHGLVRLWRQTAPRALTLTLAGLAFVLLAGALVAAIGLAGTFVIGFGSALPVLAMTVLAILVFALAIARWGAAFGFIATEGLGLGAFATAAALSRGLRRPVAATAALMLLVALLYPPALTGLLVGIAFAIATPSGQDTLFVVIVVLGSELSVLMVAAFLAVYWRRLVTLREGGPSVQVLAAFD
jgi:hypothetical protein